MCCTCNYHYHHHHQYHWLAHQCSAPAAPTALSLRLDSRCRAEPGSPEALPSLIGYFCTSSYEWTISLIVHFCRPMKEIPKNTLAELLAAHSASASCGPVLPPAHLHQQNYPEWSFFVAFFWCSNGIHLCKVSQFILLLFSIFLHCQELALKILVFKESNPQFCQQRKIYLEIRLHLCKRLSFPCKSLSQPTLVVQIRLQCCLKLRNLNLQRILCCLEKMTIISTAKRCS